MSSFYYKTRAKGFTLVETVVAVAILTAAVTGPLFLAFQGVKANRDAKYELVASHLAMEAIEIIQSIRNNNSADDPSASGANWVSNVMAECGGTYGCVIDISETAAGSVWDTGPNKVMTSCPNTLCTQGSHDRSRMYVDNVSGLYRQSSNIPGANWEASLYRRIVRTDYIDNAGAVSVAATPQVRVTSNVYFTRANNTSGSVTLHADLYNWFPDL